MREDESIDREKRRGIRRRGNSSGEFPFFCLFLLPYRPNGEVHLRPSPTLKFKSKMAPFLFLSVL